MTITFLIGNGFDLNLNLKTRYLDFYPYFIKKASEDNVIKTWIDGNEKLWSDLEEKLGLELSRIEKDNIEKFYDSKEELDTLLLDYLYEEQIKYNYEQSEIIKKEFSRSLLQLSKGLTVVESNSIKETFEVYKDSDHIYKFITFNYTDILDNIVNMYDNEKNISSHQGKSSGKKDRIGEVLHIHGTIDREMILGVNDQEQISNDELCKDNIFLDTFIKTRMNSGVGQRKTERAKKIIQESHIICIFGMSMGNTDKIWWEEIIEWLVVNANNKLIIFWKGYEDALKRRLPAKLIRINEEIRRRLFDKGKGKYTEKEYIAIKERIIISYNSDIFSLPKISD